MTRSDPPGESYWRFIDPYWFVLNESWDYGPAAFVAALRTVPSRAQHLYACHWCQSEVLNGGFYHFFHNSTGIVAPEASAGFEAMGARELAAIVAQAMAHFGSKYPRDREVRLRVLPESQGEAFAASDAEFNDWMDANRYRWERLADRYAMGT